MTRRKRQRIGYLVFDGVQALDLFGPLDAFAEANDQIDGANYENVVISETGGPVTTSSGVVLNAHASIRDCAPIDTLIIAGGSGARAIDFSNDVIDWVSDIAPGLQRLGSICTGLFILAQTGLLAGRQVTTHWHHTREAQERFPDLEIVDDALFLREGKIFTAAGVTAGIDMTLALIEDDFGPSAASLVARHLVVFVKRPGDQRQYSSILRHQTQAAGEFADLTAWIADHVADDISSEDLAHRVSLSERQFRRRFAQAFGETPTRYIERVRIETACDWLTSETQSIDAIARQAGFSNADTFRRTFERLRGVTPSEYRNRFCGVAT